MSRRDYYEYIHEKDFGEPAYGGIIVGIGQMLLGIAIGISRLFPNGKHRA